MFSTMASPRIEINLTYHNGRDFANPGFLDTRASNFVRPSNLNFGG